MGQMAGSNANSVESNSYQSCGAAVVFASGKMLRGGSSEQLGASCKVPGGGDFVTATALSLASSRPAPPKSIITGDRGCKSRWIPICAEEISGAGWQAGASHFRPFARETPSDWTRNGISATLRQTHLNQLSEPSRECPVLTTL